MSILDEMRHLLTNPQYCTPEAVLDVLAYVTNLQNRVTDCEAKLADKSKRLRTSIHENNRFSELLETAEARVAELEKELKDEFNETIQGESKFRQEADQLKARVAELEAIEILIVDSTSDPGKPKMSQGGLDLIKDLQNKVVELEECNKNQFDALIQLDLIPMT